MESMTSFLCCSAFQITHNVAVSPVLSKERYLPQPALYSHSTNELMLTALCGQAMYLYYFKLTNSVITCITWNFIKSLIFKWPLWQKRSNSAFHVQHFDLPRLQRLYCVHPPWDNSAEVAVAWPHFPCSCFFLVRAPLRSPLSPFTLWVRWKKTLQFSHTCTEVFPLSFFDRDLLSALPVKNDQNIQSVIAEHTWVNHSNGEVMYGKYLKYLNLFS